MSYARTVREEFFSHPHHNHAYNLLDIKGSIVKGSTESPILCTRFHGIPDYGKKINLGIEASRLVCFLQKTMPEQLRILGL